MTEANTAIIRDCFSGAILGLAVGDALGAPVEFMTAEEIIGEHGGKVTEMIGGGKHDLDIGAYTDDTDMMLCIAESIVEMGGYIPEDVARKFVKWYKTDPKDIGGTIKTALERLEKGRSWRESGEGSKPSNGSVMRCCPIGLLHAFNETRLIEDSIKDSTITHPHEDAVAACIFLNLMISKIIRGKEKNAAFAETVERVGRINGKFIESYFRPGYIPDPGFGSAANTLVLATSIFLQKYSFEDTIIEAINRGGDADTTGAVAGALAGAYWGTSSIPARWSDELYPESAKYFSRLGVKIFNLAIKERV